MLDEINKQIIDQPKIILEKTTVFKKRRFWVPLFMVLSILIGLFLSVLGMGYFYKLRVLPNTFVGILPIGGLTKEELKTAITSMNDKLSSEGISFDYQTNSDHKTKLVYPFIVEGENTVELVKIDIENEVNYLLKQGHSSNYFLNGLSAVESFFVPETLNLQNVEVDSPRLIAILAQDLSIYETPFSNASVQINTLEPLDFNVTSAKAGIVYDYSGIIKEVKNKWSKLEAVQIQVKLREKMPIILEKDVETIKDRLPMVFSPGVVEVTYQDPVIGEYRRWKINEIKIKNWLEVQKTPENEIVFGLNVDKVQEFLQNNVSQYVNVSAVDAKFKTDESGRVIEFQGSRPGIKLDLEKTANDINSIVWGRTWHDQGVPKTVAVTIATVEPLIKTGDVNNLGIKDVLGVGVSDYSNSPVNRIKNITNAVNKLNGILIKPGEEFSTLKYTSPFTLEGGYFSELVIKGNELKPEIGGGLCQIATTLFRMAMNSGLKIVNRRNHALVVSHYNDPVNGNPGTDATVYDPAPDFTFLNDTGNYILLQTTMNKKTQELVFTLWGTSDGRKGYYTHPIVKKWYSPGEEIITETTDLKPGETKCQNAFAGADATFTYTIVRPDNQQEEIVFDSHYKPLPKTCLKGVEVITEGSSVSSSTEGIVVSVE